MTSITKILDVDDGCAGANSGSEGNDQGVGDRKEDFNPRNHATFCFIRASSFPLK